MNPILRNAIVAAGAAATIVGSTTPASAVASTTVVFAGTATLNCFGCGTRTTGNHMEWDVSGLVRNRIVVGQHGVADSSTGFTISESTGVTCVAIGSAWFNLHLGSAVLELSWTRIGGVLLISVRDTGGLYESGYGAGTFTITDPAGSPCGQKVTATVSGSFSTIS